MLLLRKEVHRKWKQEWATQEEYKDIAQKNMETLPKHVGLN